MGSDADFCLVSHSRTHEDLVYVPYCIIVCHFENGAGCVVCVCGCICSCASCTVSFYVILGHSVCPLILFYSRLSCRFSCVAIEALIAFGVLNYLHRLGLSDRVTLLIGTLFELVGYSSTSFFCHLLAISYRWAHHVSKADRELIRSLVSFDFRLLSFGWLFFAKTRGRETMPFSGRCSWG